MADTLDTNVVAQLTAMHIEEPEMVAGILAKHGVTICPLNEDDDEPTD